ncbi:MAG: RNA polymerase subunit sigma [Proteobacteria bacterium]|nr:RNA polymerase subunit sigma [Pseudomonadota bacterium]
MSSTLQESLADQDKHITVLTGAGISAESGIPTFRGTEGYWTIGSKEYHPQEMATYAMFTERPDEVWKWYLYRLSVCGNAKPNQGHLALVEMERRLQDRFTLITQNVDNLHIRAGNSPERTYQIHGNVFFMRCVNECKESIYPLPMEILPRDKDQHLSSDDKKILSCPDCGAGTRPHVLWFDEIYDEHYFKFESAMAVAAKTDVLIIAGTSGATTLPNHIANIVYHNGGMIIDINIEQTPFTELAVNSVNGDFLNMTCSEGLAKILMIMKD